MGTYSIECIFTGSPIPATNFQNMWFPQVPLEITVKNKAHSGNIPAGAPFVTVISEGIY
jgi:hypothetical protein